MHFEIVIVLLTLKKCHVFTTLGPKIVYEITQTACYLIMKSDVFMSYFIYIL